ncbi:hypothetical protein MUK42_06084 [Musa troglodytarum]|uniref:Uncharacterized protein n=1 Tax=Musa troglodytarum TaxID=320322 RepID=A0A9E7KHA4_9LILI|nr:hypothetical protein MUK42_06084 [Musa troglodytarum]
MEVDRIMVVTYTYTSNTSKLSTASDGSAFLPVLLAVHGIGVRWHPLPNALSHLVNILPPVAAPPPPPPPPVLGPDQQHVDHALQRVPRDPDAERGVGPLPGGGPKHGNGHSREGQVPADVERHHGP